MKRYKLLKDLPTFKAGEEFFISKSGNLIAGTPSDPKQITVETRYGFPMKIDLMAYAQETLEEFPNILTDWFEEIEELKMPKEFFFISVNKVVNVNYNSFSFDEESRQNYRDIIEKYKSVGNCFKTKEEAEEYLEYLKAKVIIEQDADFYPDWSDLDEEKYYGFWNWNVDEIDCGYTYGDKQSDMYFKSEKDIKESFKKHPEEWKVYLFHEL